VTWFWNSCRRNEQSVSLLVAGVCPEEERARVEKHLAQCPQCKARYEREGAVAATLRSCVAVAALSEPPVTLRKRWQVALRLELESRSDAPPDQPSLLPAWLAGNRWVWGTAAACWVLIAALHASAPRNSRPAVVQAPVTWKQIQMALEKVDLTRPQTAARQQHPSGATSQPPEFLPRSRRSLDVDLC
jgi:anti-sigma factor RsiW